MTEADFAALWVTLKLAALSTLILLVIGAPLAWWLARTTWSYKFILEAFIALPVVLPPTVLGFYLLLLFAPNGAVGEVVSSLGFDSLAFTFPGILIASVFYSLPFVVQPLQDAFNRIGNRPFEVAATLRASPWDCFFSIALPLARQGFFTAAVLGFAHTVGEFGVVLMIGGNIPGQTQVASIAIYEHVESMQYAQAHWLSACLLILSFVLLVAVYAINRRYRILRV